MTRCGLIAKTLADSLVGEKAEGKTYSSKGIRTVLQVDHMRQNSTKCYRSACQLDLEAIVAKKGRAPVRATLDSSSLDWD
jgi:hypothetical protein